MKEITDFSYQKIVFCRFPSFKNSSVFIQYPLCKFKTKSNIPILQSLQKITKIFHFFKILTFVSNIFWRICAQFNHLFIAKFNYDVQKWKNNLFNENGWQLKQKRSLIPFYPLVSPDTLNILNCSIFQRYFSTFVRRTCANFNRLLNQSNCDACKLKNNSLFWCKVQKNKKIACVCCFYAICNSVNLFSKSSDAYF